ncbi:hypothetical protein HHK36_015861 [Tetracentron sinense]|uniref:DNA primase large subunit C-terminal domain-containing protein n=1 Tax=Tetracentron sinense TaxID=13715 RepID=A0A835DE16_TETSI|nr:hypothetical protein HHK36_015861 [Tetracentron sinense]
MEIVRSQRKSSVTDVAPTLPLYRSAPALEVRLDDFELFAIDRLRVLKGISDGLSRGRKPEEMEKLVRDLWRTNMRHQNTSEVINKDIISHFVLRLVYCRTEELRKWFLSMETTLFRYRFRLEIPEAQRALMGEFDLLYKAVGSAEFESVKEILGQVARSIGQPLPNADTIFFKVPFEEVPELVAGRRVYICKGYAYVPMNQVVSLVVTQFRSYLSKALVLTNRKWTSTIREQEKDRLTPIVEALSTSYLGPDYSQPKEFAEISIKDIDQVANTSFPLCMRHLFEKGVGLKLDDALAFWRAEFSQKVGTERFDKEYAYSIRHNYGKEGKRTDYTPYSCQKIISSTPGVGDHHGCPYRHFRFTLKLMHFHLPQGHATRQNAVYHSEITFFLSTQTSTVKLTSKQIYDFYHDCFLLVCLLLESEENLRAALGKMGVSDRAVEDIMDKVRNRHYQLACTLTFEAVHDSSCDAGINHPNQYFSDSQKILQSKMVIPLGEQLGGMVCICMRQHELVDRKL